MNNNVFDNNDYLNQLQKDIVMSKHRKFEFY
jgi:hypothetical protein